MKRRILLAAFVASSLASPFPSKSAKAEKEKAAATTTERGVGVGVTEKIAPTAPPPAACTVNYNGEFAIAVMNITGNGKWSMEDSPPSPGLNASIRTNGSSAASSNGKPAVLATLTPAPPLPVATGAASDGGLAAGAPEGVHSEASVGAEAGGGAANGVGAASAKPASGPKPATGAVPSEEPGATVTMRSTRTQTRTVTVRRTVVGSKPSANAKGQVKAGLISQIADGQIQAPVQPTMMSMTTYNTGAPAPKATAAGTSAAGAPVPPKSSAAGAPPIPTSSAGGAPGVAPGGVPGGVSGGAPGVAPGGGPSASGSIATRQSTVMAVSEISDGQIQAPVAKAAATAKYAALAIRQAPGDATQLVACKTPNTLQITMKDGVLKDAKGRTGYIASNYQFQFDGPPQSGSIYTAGFSVCANGSLSLGGSSVWYQCRSGGFYNLYDRWWAPQCNAVTINAVMLKQC